MKLAFILNDAARKATYKKRKKGLLKKIDELSTLCGIEACAIVYSPYEPQPKIWPSPWGVQNVLSKFRTMPEMEQSKKMMNQETFMNQRVMKAKEQVKKQQKDNKEKEMALLMFQCLNAGKIMDNNMSVVDVNNLAWLIDQNLKDIGRRLEGVDNNGQIQSQNQIMTTPTQSEVRFEMAPPLPFKKEEMTMMGHDHFGITMNNGDIMQRQFFMNLVMNDNIDEKVPFGHPHDASLQNEFWPNLLP